MNDLIPTSRIRTNGGQAALIAVFITMSLFLAVTLGLSSLALKEARNVHTNILGAQSYFTSEAGHEDIIYRVKTGRLYSSTEAIALASTSATTTVTSSGGDLDILTSGSVSNNVRRVRSTLAISSSIQFFYGVQSDEGGIILENNSSIRGNIYSNGPVNGANSNIVRGDVVSAGASGTIDGVHATSSGYAHTISNSTLDKNAYYQVISNTTVGGSSFPGSSDQPTTTLPISDDLIEEWKTAAAAGGTHTTPCPYVIENSTTLGPKKIDCDLTIQGTAIVTLNGPVWVKGKILIQNSATLRIAPSQGAKSIAIIADDPNDRLDSSSIILQNSSIYEGSGASNSYILFVSANESAESGGANKAIEVKNFVEGDLLVYAGHGEIVLENNINLKEVTAWRIRVKNSAEVVYETGLASLLFSSGPGGGYSHVDWREVE